MYDVDKLRELNSLLLVCGNDYSDVLLDAALEIERLRGGIEMVMEYDSNLIDALRRAALGKQQ